MNFSTVAIKHLITATSLEELETKIVADIKKLTGAREVTIELTDNEKHQTNNPATFVLNYQGKQLGFITLSAVKLTHEQKETLEIYSSLVGIVVQSLQHKAFLSYASHEIRNPLTSISGYIQLIDRKLAKKESVNPRWVKALLQEVNRLDLLVKALLSQSV